MPALAASRFDPAARHVRDTLIERGLKPIQAIVAVMRRLLVAIRAILKSGHPYQSERFHHVTTHA
jgi:hypothetical protein